MMRMDKGFYGLLIAAAFSLALMAGCGIPNPLNNIDSDTTSNTALAESTSPPAQAAITDSAGQTSFVSSEGKIVNFKVVDSTSQQPLSNISVSFEENQNGILVAKMADSSSTYVPIISLSSIEPPPSSSQKSVPYKSANDIAIPLSSSEIDFTVEMLPFGSLGVATTQHNLAIDYLIEDNTNIVPFGTIKDIKYMTVQEYINLVMSPNS